MLSMYDRPYNDKQFVDLMEVMGGEGRTTQCFVRRRFKKGLRVGRNMDLICNVDLLDPDDVPDMEIHSSY